MIKVLLLYDQPVHSSTLTHATFVTVFCTSLWQDFYPRHDQVLEPVLALKDDF